MFTFVMYKMAQSIFMDQKEPARQEPTPKEQLLTSLEETIHRLILLLWQEPQLLQTVLYVYENLHNTRELLKGKSEWK